MEDLYHLVMSKQLDGPGPVEVAEILASSGDGMSNNRAGGRAKGNTNRSNPPRGKGKGAKRNLKYTMPKHHVFDIDDDSDDSDQECHRKESSDEWRFDLRQIACEVFVDKVCSGDVVHEDIIVDFLC